MESAESLPDLRNLVLQAHINIAWRDRAAFRDQWIERLRRVYLRQDDEPDSNLASLKAWQLYKSPQPASTSGSRVFSHVRITPRKPSATATSGEEEGSPDSDSRSKRRSKRLSDQAIIQAATPPPQPEPVQPKSKSRRKGGPRESEVSVASLDQEGSDRDDWRDKPEKFIQGLCNIVDIKIDNQRPREDQQLNESHFLDSEASGDEEWTEGADGGDDGYAW